MIKMVGRVLGDGEKHTREGEKRSRGCKENKRKGWEKTRRWPEIEWGWGEVRGLERWEGGREWQLGEIERMWVWLTWRSLVVLKKKPTLKCMAILFKLVHVNGSFFTVSEFLLIWLLSLNNKHPNQLITLEAILSSSSLSNVKWEVKALAWPWLLNKQRLTSGPRTTPCSNLSYKQEHRWSDFNQNGPQQNKLTQNIYQC